MPDEKKPNRLSVDTFINILKYQSPWNERIASARAVKEKKNQLLAQAHLALEKQISSSTTSSTNTQNMEIGQDVDILRGQIGNIKGKLKNVAELLRIARENKQKISQKETISHTVDISNEISHDKISAADYQKMHQSVRQMNLSSDLVPTVEFLLSEDGEEIKQITE